MIPYGHQDINRADIEAVVRVLQSDWLTQGPDIENFEKAVADYCGAKYAVAVNSATSALHIACMAAGLTKGRMLWTTPNTFVASSNCGLYCGADVSFVDINPKTYNLDADELKKKIEQQDQQKPDVIIPVHFSGQACDMKAIAALAKEHHVTVIEDASHAIGGEYDGKKIGCCEYSDMTVFSFHPVKIITTGEGGMVLTNRTDLYNKLLLARSHGITRDKALMLEPDEGPWYYEQVDLGYNYRMTDLQAALGESQLKRIDEFVAKRRALAARYDRLLAKLPVVRPYQAKDGASAWHLYVIQLDTDKTHIARREAFEQLREKGIGVNVHYIPVHLQPYYRQLGFKEGAYPVAEQYYSRAITLPLYAAMSEAQQDAVVAALREVLQQ